MTLLSVVLALALTVALAACGSDEPSGVIVRTPTETPASPAQTPTTTGSGDAPIATDTPVPTAATAPPAASGSAETDRPALAALYNAMGGEKNWPNQQNWLSDAPLDEWDGVTTNDDGRVIELVLAYNGLSGEIPAELGSLSNLTKLSFFGNDLSGEIPPWLGSLSNLEILSLSRTGLSGEIPAELGSLSNLRGLYLSENQLSGEIPAELGSLSNLRVLNLKRNGLIGEIPAELGNLSSLTELSLAGNYQLSGCVPSSLEDQLDFDESDIGGLPFC